MIFASLQNLVYLVLFVAIFGLSVWGLVDALIRKPQAFVSAGKRTKTGTAKKAGKSAEDKRQALSDWLAEQQKGGFRT